MNINFFIGFLRKLYKSRIRNEPILNAQNTKGGIQKPPKKTGPYRKAIRVGNLKTQHHAKVCN